MALSPLLGCPLDHSVLACACYVHPARGWSASMSRIRLIDHNVFMAIRRSRERRPSVMDVVDGLLFAFAGLATIWLAYLVVKESIRPGWPLLLLVVFWVLLTYLLLPRLHRIMTQAVRPRIFHWPRPNQ